MPVVQDVTYEKRQEGEFLWTYLSHFGIFAHKRLISGGEFRRELVDVQHVHGDGHSAGQDGTVWGEKRNAWFRRSPQVQEMDVLDAKPPS